MPLEINQDINISLFQAVVNLSVEGILIASKNTVIYMNESFRQLLEIESNTDVPIEIKDLFPENKYGDLSIQILADEATLPRKSLIISHKNYFFDVEIENIKISEKNFRFIRIFPKNNFVGKRDGTEEYSLDFFPYIMLETNRDGKILKINEQFIQTLNFESKDIEKGIMLHDIVGVVNVPIINSLFNNFEEFSNTKSIELRLKRKTGTLFPVNMFFKTLFEGNDFVGLKCIFFDI